MRIPALALLLVALPMQAADLATLQRQLERGSTAERTAALRELARQDPAAAATRSVAWLAPGVEPALRRSAARTLWDLGDKARAAEPALRTCKDDADDDVAYACVGALSTLGVPKADLRSARLRLARSNDGFIAFYAARALYPDPDLPIDVALDAALAAINLTAAGRPSDFQTRDTLRSNARAFLSAFAAKSGRPGFDALMRAFPNAAPPSKDAIAYVLDKVPPQHGDPAQIAALLASERPDVKRGALYALASYRERARAAIPQMVACLGAPNPPEVRKVAATALGNLGEAPATADEQAEQSAWRREVETRIGPALANTATGDPDRDVRKEAADALHDLALWAGPALGAIGERIPREPDPNVRHSLVRACWTARASPQLPRAVLADLAANDPDEYVRNEAKVTLQATRP